MVPSGVPSWGKRGLCRRPGVAAGPCCGSLRFGDRERSRGRLPKFIPTSLLPAFAPRIPRIRTWVCAPRGLRSPVLPGPSWRGSPDKLSGLGGLARQTPEAGTRGRQACERSGPVGEKFVCGNRGYRGQSRSDPSWTRATSGQGFRAPGPAAPLGSRVTRRWLGGHRCPSGSSVPGGVTGRGGGSCTPAGLGSGT